MDFSPNSQVACMRRLPYRSHGFHCPYNCGYLFKTPGGVTRHKYTCAKNPENIYIPPSAPSPELSPESPPRTPSRPDENFQAFDYQDFIFPNPQALIFPPRTPANPGNTLANTPYESPRRVRWITKGGVRMHIHPLIDGSSFDDCSALQQYLATF